VDSIFTIYYAYKVLSDAQKVVINDKSLVENQNL